MLNCSEPISRVFSKEVELVSEQLNCYFNDSQHCFALPIEAKGTEFQHKVWDALKKIPVGTVKTYGEVAKELNSSARAIGNACRNNPTPIVVPCHRVVAASGLGGFAGATQGQLTSIKSQLLAHEGVVV